MKPAVTEQQKKQQPQTNATAPPRRIQIPRASSVLIFKSSEEGWTLGRAEARCKHVAKRRRRPRQGTGSGRPAGATPSPTPTTRAPASRSSPLCEAWTEQRNSRTCTQCKHSQGVSSSVASFRADGTRACKQAPTPPQRHPTGDAHPQWPRYTRGHVGHRPCHVWSRLRDHICGHVTYPRRRGPSWPAANGPGEQGRHVTVLARGLAGPRAFGVTCVRGTCLGGHVPLAVLRCHARCHVA
jgi:hypothetical protein